MLDRVISTVITPSPAIANAAMMTTFFPAGVLALNHAQRAPKSQISIAIKISISTSRPQSAANLDAA